MSKLFSPIRLGDLLLKNRIVMAPLTRSRAGVERVPNDLMALYYAQRATAGLIISEATSITPMAVGYKDTPGIWNENQIDGWKKITKAVQDKGSAIFLQLWHVGRISHPYYLNGEVPVSSSALKPPGNVSQIRPLIPFITPRALKTIEIKNIVKDYKQAALNAKKAGFDGVEIHGANGYLIDQFLHENTNLRNDEYGGNIENRMRFLLEVVDACIEVWGSPRVGVHLSPRGDSYEMKDGNKRALFTQVAKSLSERRIAFIFTREHQGLDSISRTMRDHFGGVFIVNEKYDRNLALEAVDYGAADMVSFGTLYISNPDLVRRLKEDLPLNETNWKTVYAEGETGYTDYPFYPHV